MKQEEEAKMEEVREKKVGITKKDWVREVERKMNGRGRKERTEKE